MRNIVCTDLSYSPKSRVKLRLHYSPKEYKEFNSLGIARRAFVNAAIGQDQVALVRENGFVYEVTVNDVKSNTITKYLFGNYKQVENCLKEVFPCWLN